MNTKEPYRECPRFNTCSVNRCPLHPDYLTLETSRHDAEKKCGLAKPYRMRIAERYPGALPTMGMTGREYSTWSKMQDPEFREKAIGNLVSIKPGSNF